ncbi:glycoside hydrolase superfamily [Microdochium bolleyi]|uniref:Glycoside hydrolase superfamily n=1 Tax=Microdochium bolleyi TaxID=196109 RepID=A0A136IX73_9PEZI|nr:glycoside hydrolase superfamily [Microdochium bolleyi]
MADSRKSLTPRFVAYCCTHTADDADHHQRKPPFKDWLSMLMLTEPGQRVTHVNLGQWWWAPDKYNGDAYNMVFLNDDEWHEPGGDPEQLNGRIYTEVKQLQAKGVKVLTQLTFFWGSNGFGQEGEFNEHLYILLHTMLSQTGFDGVDLDVEDSATDNAKVTALIKRLKKDFGPQFLITMAPGGNELVVDGGSLSHVNYRELYEKIGDDIDWFNVQLYNGWGKLSLHDFDRFVKAGGDKPFYPPHKIVMSVASNFQNTNSGDWTDGATIEKHLPEILAKYPDMGGLSCWEWYNATWTDVPPKTIIEHPEKWFQKAYKVLRGGAVTEA